MTDFWTPFHDLRMQAEETMQTATIWSVGRTALVEMKRNIFPPMVDMSGNPVDRFCGIEIKVDPSLPENRVVLRAGQNTVGAFTILDDK